MPEQIIGGPLFESRIACNRGPGAYMLRIFQSQPSNPRVLTVHDERFTTHGTTVEESEAQLREELTLLKADEHVNIVEIARICSQATHVQAAVVPPGRSYPWQYERVFAGPVVDSSIRMIPVNLRSAFYGMDTTTGLAHATNSETHEPIDNVIFLGRNLLGNVRGGLPPVNGQLFVTRDGLHMVAHEPQITTPLVIDQPVVLPELSPAN